MSHFYGMDPLDELESLIDHTSMAQVLRTLTEIAERKGLYLAPIHSGEAADFQSLTHQLRNVANWAQSQQL